MPKAKKPVAAPAASETVAPEAVAPEAVAPEAVAPAAPAETTAPAASETVAAPAASAEEKAIAHDLSAAADAVGSVTKKLDAYGRTVLINTVKARGKLADAIEAAIGRVRAQFDIERQTVEKVTDAKVAKNLSTQAWHACGANRQASSLKKSAAVLSALPCDFALFVLSGGVLRYNGESGTSESKRAGIGTQTIERWVPGNSKEAGAMESLYILWRDERATLELIGKDGMPGLTVARPVLIQQDAAKSDAKSDAPPIISGQTEKQAIDERVESDLIDKAKKSANGAQFAAQNEKSKAEPSAYSIEALADDIGRLIKDATANGVRAKSQENIEKAMLILWKAKDALLSIE
jgi:hypothetical protein